MVSLSTPYLCQNMKLFANKLGKVRLFWFFDYSFTKKGKFHLPSSDKPPPPPQKKKKLNEIKKEFTWVRGAKLSQIV